MSPTINPGLYFRKSVNKNEYPVPNEHLTYETTSSIDLETTPLHGGILIKTLFASLDPYMRGRMRDPSIKSYSAPFELDKPIEGGLIGEVIRSENNEFKPGQHVRLTHLYQQYTIVPPDVPVTLLKDVGGLSLSAYLGVLGMPGLTAYSGLEHLASMKKGETLFVSTGAGAVGSLIIQLAKLAGLKVIASGGSATKVNFMKKCGADVAFDYKTSSTADILEKNGPIDIYWDNVGGETLDTALLHMNTLGRIIICGQASQYNSKPHPIMNIDQVLSKRLAINGFLVRATQEKYQEPFNQFLIDKVARGEIIYQEELVDLEKAPEAFTAMLKGGNTGKVVIKF